MISIIATDQSATLKPTKTPALSMPLKVIHKPIRYLILGRSGSGKSSLAVNPVVSYTTRPQRGPDDTDHYFIKPEQVKNYPDKIAYTKIGNYEYFATKQELDRSICYIIDYDGLQTLHAPDYELVSIYISVSPEIQKQRLLARGDSEEVIAKRLAAEDEQFSKIEALRDYDYCIKNNGDLEDAQEELFHIMQFESNYPLNQERFYFQRKYFNYQPPDDLQQIEKHWGYAYQTPQNEFVTLTPQKSGEYRYKVISPKNTLTKNISKTKFDTLQLCYKKTSKAIRITDLWLGRKGTCSS